MISNKNDMPASPIVNQHGTPRNLRDRENGAIGLTIRQHTSIAMMQGLMSNTDLTHQGYDATAAQAIAAADALLNRW